MCSAVSSASPHRGHKGESRSDRRERCMRCCVCTPPAMAFARNPRSHSLSCLLYTSPSPRD
eukprot:10721483-Alexandrium_andersonii.AAC.1